jgi:non-heme chloroperoxidase
VTLPPAASMDRCDSMGISSTHASLP